MLERTIDPLDHYRGCLLGGAAGDALGAAVEFDDIADDPTPVSARRASPSRRAAYGRVGAITDDTQMTLFTAEGVLQADDRLERGVGNTALNLWFAYQRWLQTQGVTAPWTGEPEQLTTASCTASPSCTPAAPRQHLPERAAEHSSTGRGRRVSVAKNDSKGCGGVMRAAPCGLVDWGDGADLRARRGVRRADARPSVRPSRRRRAGADHPPALRRPAAAPAAVDAAIEILGGDDGSDEVRDALRRARDLAAAHVGPPDVAPLGQGWVAEEALAIAVYCALTHPDDFAAAVRLAANHSGDSDSTAAITGNIMGALLGADAIPASWLAVLELRDTIDRLATAMHDRFVLRRTDVDWELWNYLDEPDREAPAPPHDAYWVTPGRLLAGPYPGAKYGVEAEGKLNDFLDLGVTCFIDLTEEGESDLEPYAALLRTLARRRGVEVTHMRMPIRDVDVAPTWRMRAIQDAIARALDAGEVVYVHCWGGVGRTGTVIGCHLVQNNHSGPEALPALKQLRRRHQRAHRVSPETSAQRAMVKHWNAA